MVRDWINKIIGIIEESSLTDSEFATVKSTTIEYTQKTFDEIALILDSRGSISDSRKRLAFLYKAKGFNVGGGDDLAVSNIWIGSVL